MSDIKISVIIPIFNMEKYLQECLDTVVSQTLKEIEIICINDGSKDSSEEIIKRNAERDSRVVLLSQENQGVARARNNGLNIAKGKYVIFMDPDDWYPCEDVLETLYDAAEKNNVLICGGSFSEQTENGLITEFTGAKSKYKFKKNGLMEYKDYQFDYGYHRFIYNLSFLKENNIYFPEYIRFQDPPFFVKAMSTAKVFYAMKKITYKYRVGTQKILWTNKKLLHLMYGLRDDLRISGENELDQLHRITLERIGHNYFSWYETRIDTLPFEIVPALLDVCTYVNMNLLQDDDKYLKYIKDIFTLAQTMFYLRKDQWDAKDEEMKDCEERMLKLAPVIYGTDEELYGNLGGKAKYAVQNCEKRNRDKTETETVQIVKRKSEIAPLVSVIIPVYNVALYLEECLDSILNQTLKQIEIICVNDGSTDDSMQILLQYAQKDERICVCQHENSGLSATRNAGVKQATGKYIYFMDSDDILEANALEMLYNKSEEQDLDVVFFDGSSFSTSDSCDEQVKKYKDYYNRKHTYAEDAYTGPELMTEMLNAEEYRTSACLQMIRRTFFVENNLWFVKGILHEDNIFTFCCMLSAKRAGYVKASLFNRRVREESIMTAKTTFEHAYGYFRSYVMMDDFIKKVCLDSQEEIAVVNLMYKVLHNSRSCFSKLSAEEKYAVMGLNPYERTLFKLYVSDMDTLRDNYTEVRDKLKLAYKENTKKANEIKRLKKVKKSRDYKIGKKVLWLPRKLKKLMGILFKH